MVRYSQSPRSMELKFPSIRLLFILSGLFLFGLSGCRSILRDVVVDNDSEFEPRTGVEGQVSRPLEPEPEPMGEGDAGRDDLEPVLVFNCPRPGLYNCDGRALQLCTEVPSGTEWLTAKVCASEALCVEVPGDCLPQLCDPGELRCNAATLESCGTGLDRWSPLQECDSPGHCDNVQDRACRISPCQEGERRCNDGALEQCLDDGLGYQVVQNCATQALCEQTQDRCALQGGCEEVPTCADPVCFPGETRCLGAEFQRCNTGRTGFVTEQTCVSAELCAAGPVVEGCQAAACAPGEHQCSGAQLEICASGQHQFELKNRCINSAHCDPVGGQCTEATCVPGERRCNGRQIESCNAEQTAFVSRGEAPCATAELCRNTGNNNVFCQAPACQPNQFACNGVQLQRCNAGQTAFESAGQPNCETPQLCSAAERRCREPICRAGFNSCNGTQLRVCREGRDSFDVLTDCANQGGCNPQTGQCGDPCLIGQPRCNGSVVERCDDPNVGWRQVAFCASDALCQQGVAAGGCANPVCQPGEVRCQGNSLQRCNSGRTGFDTLQTCGGNQICDASGVQCDNCAPNTFSCQGNQLRRCSSDGQTQQVQESCPSANLCSEQQARCLRCAPAGGFRCEGAQNLFQCSADQSSESQLEVCREPGLCRANATGGQCLQCNSPGSRRCDGAAVVQCARNNTEFTMQTCASVALCRDDGNGQAACDGPACPAAGAFQCNEQGELQQCNDDLTGTTRVDTCATPALCNAQAGRCEAPACQAGQRRCEGSQVFACNAARTGFTPVATCDSAALCQDNGQGQASCADPVCNAGQRRCQGAQLQVCNEGLDGFRTLDACGSDQLCDNTLQRPGARACDRCEGASCSGASLVQCAQGQPGERVSCEFGCSAGRCEQCSDEDCPGSQVCFQNRCVVCTADGGGCEPGQQCLLGEECVDCLADNDCAGSSVCVGNSCVQCREATDCDDNDPCTVEACSNSACGQSPLCGGDTPVCTGNGVCTGRCVDADCGSFGCNAARTACNACNTDTNCNGSTIALAPCEIAECNGQSCEAVSACVGDQFCRAGQCVDPCGPANCNASTIDLGACQIAECNGQECQGADVCGAGEVCIDGIRCVERCGPENCTANEVNLGPCQRAACGGGDGQTCVATGGCGANEFCDASNECVPRCNEAECVASAGACEVASCSEQNVCVVRSLCDSTEECVNFGGVFACEERCNEAINCSGDPSQCIVAQCGANNECIETGCAGGQTCTADGCAATCGPQTGCVSDAANCSFASCNASNECIVDTCDEELEVCQGGACTPRCDPDQCPFGCNASNTACNGCDAELCPGGDEAQCTVAQCVNGACSVVSRCADGQICDGSGSCELRCSANNCIGNVDECVEATCGDDNVCRQVSRCGDLACLDGECVVPCEESQCAFGCNRDTNECNPCIANECSFGCNAAGTDCDACQQEDCAFGCSAQGDSCLACTAEACSVGLGPCEVGSCDGDRCLVTRCSSGQVCDVEQNECVDAPVETAAP